MINLLGREVKDRVTGFKGIAVAVYIYLQGCVRYSVQPKIKKDGTLPKDQVFDEPQLEIIGKRKIKAEIEENGGPALYLPTERPSP